MRYSLVCGHRPVRLDGCDPTDQQAQTDQELVWRFFERLSGAYGPDTAQAIADNPACRVYRPDALLVSAPTRSGMGAQQPSVAQLLRAQGQQ
ncbi:hypothetical protein [Azohydromonas aeria]|uniref:hypothetical protein n=1 Tax=Azohydromonas aeria TaxID=2590212 RepID=UPI0012FB9F8E|nr:hypothetical protein [Azohydromonas aeria]